MGVQGLPELFSWLYTQRLTPGIALGTMCGVRDQTQTSHMQGSPFSLAKLLFLSIFSNSSFALTPALTQSGFSFPGNC